jgi:hypothetical protein
MQRLAAILVGLLVLAGVAVVVLDPGGGRGLAGASPTAEPSPSASAEPAETPGSSAPDDEDLLAALREIEEQVIAIRGLERADIGAPDIISREELAIELERLFDEEYPPEERERDNRVLRALGLLDEDEDVAELQLQLLGDSVLGFYDDVEQRMVVVSDAGLDAEARLTYAHEYAHALQDAAFDLDSLENEELGEDDRALARTALVEGDATVVMLAWAFANLTPQELMGIATTPIPDMSGIPSWMIAQLEFPYAAGQLWVGSLAGDPLAPDFAAVDAAWADPPDTTEQVIEPGAWDAREPALPVELPELEAVLGAGWEELDTTPVGQASIGIFLEHHGVAPGAAATAARGWGGDRVTVASGPDGSFAVAWRLAWDTPADATEFSDAYGSIVGSLPFAASVRAVPGGDVLVVHASTDEIADQVVDAVD